MIQRKTFDNQLLAAGVRLGDGCSIVPAEGRKRDFTLNRRRIDIVSSQFRPTDLSMAYVEVPKTTQEQFHYRLEIDSLCKEGRFVLKSMTGRPFWLNGLLAREAFIERSDRLFIEESRVNFTPYDLREQTLRHFDHPILSEDNLMRSDLNILIHGETGSGKSYLAKKIHEASGRTGNFVAVNLSTYNPQLIESELFGHKRGAFTGAICDKRGAFIDAQDGTLFLDEIDSLPLELQTKLLTFLDNKKFRVVGDSKETCIRARLIFASGRSLEKLAEHGSFRRDLYFRLRSGHALELAPLRNDLLKIRETCQWFALTHHVSFTVRLLEFYETLAWPGNLRQLLGHLEKKKVLSRTSKLDFDNFDEDLLLQSSDLSSFDLTDSIQPLQKIKTDYVKKAFFACEGNYARTAKKLRLSEKTIRGLLVS